MDKIVIYINYLATRKKWCQNIPPLDLAKIKRERKETVRVMKQESTHIDDVWISNTMHTNFTYTDHIQTDVYMLTIDGQ